MRIDPDELKAFYTRDSFNGSEDDDWQKQFIEAVNGDDPSALAVFHAGLNDHGLEPEDIRLALGSVLDWSALHEGNAFWCYVYKRLAWMLLRDK